MGKQISIEGQAKILGYDTGDIEIFKNVERGTIRLKYDVYEFPCGCEITSLYHTIEPENLDKRNWAFGPCKGHQNKTVAWI